MTPSKPLLDFVLTLFSIRYDLICSDTESMDLLQRLDLNGNVRHPTALAMNQIPSRHSYAHALIPF